MKIITVSNPENGDKPTIYAAQLKGMDYLKSAVYKALHEGGRVSADETEGYLEEVCATLKERGFYWWDERLLVEVTDVTMAD